MRLSGEQYTKSRTDSELSKEGNTSESSYVDNLLAPYDISDDGQSGDEIYRSASSTPIGYLFEIQPVSK